MSPPRHRIWYRRRTRAPEPGEDRVLVTQLLRRLPINQHRALALHHLLDLPVDEIAAEMGANVNTVKSWLSRGRAAVAHLLEEESHVR